MKIGYARVSTDDQTPDLQLAALKQAGCKRIFTDTATGAHVKRPELVKCLKALKEGDTLNILRRTLYRAWRQLPAMSVILTLREVPGLDLTSYIIYFVVASA
jgi:DNA invertase Pin-like site-specific DNA recombinase